MIVIVLGAPGSGKGTQCKEIAKEYKINHISMGDIFRKNIEQKTKIGVEAESYINEGKLVPDDIAIFTLETTLNNDIDLLKGVVLDGYPRTLIQAKSFDKYLEEKNLKVDKVINLTISDQEIVSRVVNRRICSNQECGEIYNLKNNPPKVDNICDKCGAKLIKRKDDNEKTALNRVEVYHAQTEPLIDYYNKKGILTTVMGMGNLEDTVNSIREILDLQT